nr:vacuolar protein sorting-associated protein 13 isoform X2 [Halyomorpha halys]
MLKEIITNIINRALGKYVENFDSSQFSLGLGDIVFNNLELKKNCLDDLNVPVRLLYGKIGKFSLRLSYLKFFSSPSVVEVDELFILLVPNQHATYDEEAEKKCANEAKQAELQKVEDAKKKALEKGGWLSKNVRKIFLMLLYGCKEWKHSKNYKKMKKGIHTLRNGDWTSYIFLRSFLFFAFADERFCRTRSYKRLKKGIYTICDAKGTEKTPVNKSFVEKIASTFIKNIEVKIKNIHVRFEDRISHPGHKFSFGITLSSLEVKTVPPWGEVVLDPLDLIFKELSINWLCFYLNSNDTLFQLTLLLKKKELENSFRIGVGSQTNVPPSYKYLLGPINAKSNLRINLHPESDGTNFAIPKFSLSFDLEGLLICMTKEQYQDLMMFLETLSLMQTASIYRKYRPSVLTYKGNEKLWWNFAYTCIVEDIKRKKKDWDWNHIKMHRYMFQEYVKAYVNKLMTHSKEAEATCKQLEENLDVLNIVLARQMATREVAQKSVSPMIEQKKGPGFFSRFFYGSSYGEEKSQETVSISKMQDVLTPEERDDMYKAIGYTEGETPTDYPEVFVEFDLSAIIHKIEIKLIDENGVPLMTIKLTEGITTVQQRPASKSLSVNVSIEKFLIRGLDQNGTIPVLLSTKTAVSKEQPLLKVLFETNPLDNKSIDQKIHVFAEPLLVVYDALTINHLIKLFTIKENTVTSKIQAAAQAKLQEFKEVSALGLQNMLEHHLTMEIRVIIQPSSVILPQEGFYVEGCPMLAVTLGNIQIQTLPRKEFIAKEKAKDTDFTVEYLMEYSYDNFVLQLSDLQVVFATPVEKWNAPSNDMYFLQPTSLTINLGKCVITDDARLPQLKVSGQLSTVNFSIAEERLKDCLALLMSIPTPESNTIVSDTKYEDIFIRQSTLSVTRISYDRPKSLLSINEGEKKDPLKQAFEVDAKFELMELHIDITVLKDGVSKQLLQFRLNNLEVNFTQHTFVMAVELKLGSVNMMHHFGDESLNVITTSSDSIDQENYLFCVQYNNVDKNIPEFHTKYKSTLQMIEVDFTKLELMLHCEALCALMVWADEFSKGLNPSEPKQPTFRKTNELKGSSMYLAAARLGSKLDVRGSLSKLPVVKSRKSHADSTYKVDEIKIKIKAHLGEIAIMLWKDKRQLSSLGVTGGECVLGIKATYTQIDLKLRGIYLYNHDPDTLYKEILTSKEDADVLSLRFVSFENIGKRSDGVDMSVNLSFAAIRFVFINKFIFSLLSFLNHFSAARETIIDASAAAAEAAKHNVQEVIDKATRISLKIDLEAPKIVIPVSDTNVSAFILDLGQITANNSFMDVTVPNREESAVLDRLNVDLHNLQLIQVKFDGDMTKELEEHAIIQPISFILTIQRNLSSGWFLEVPDIEVGGKLKKIKITFNKSDYKLIMQMLEENLGDSGPPDENPPPKPAPLPNKRFSLAGLEEGTTGTGNLKPAVIRSTLKFTMTLESLILELEDNHPDDPNIKEGLAQVTLELVSIKGSIMSDDSLHFAVILLDFIMDDTRPSKVGKITRYMEKKKGSQDDQSTKSMIDITYQQTVEAKFADIRISSIDLILNLEHLTQVSEFFNTLSETPPSAEDFKIPAKPEAPKKRDTEVLVAEEKPEISRISVNFKVEHPDIILIENIDDLDTNALVLDFELIIAANLGNDKSLISGSLTDLQLFTCCYNPAKRSQTKAPVLNPVTFLVSGSGEEGNTRIEIDSTRIKVSVTPGVVNLLSKVVSMLTSSSNVEDKDVIMQTIDRSNMWDVTDFYDSDFTFLKTEMATDALVEENRPRKSSHKTVSKVPSKLESISFKILQITITLEAGFGRATMPLLFVDASVDVAAYNWSSKLHVDAKLFLEVSYYNSQHAMWEPLLEPVPARQNPDAVKTEHSPWKIKVVVDSATEDDLSLENSPKQGTENKEQQASTTIAVHSDDILNITISKKSLEVLTGLGTTLQAAIFKPEEYDGDKSPYIVKNECGLSVKILLDDEFMVYSSDEENIDVKFVFLDNDSYVGLKSSSEIEYLGLSEETKEKFIHILVVDYDCHIQIPVLKSAKRFFLIGHRGPGNDQWGIVADVIILNGQTMVTLRGIIQVENTHNMPINVYSMTDKENELHLIGTVKPKDLLNLPLDSIYTQTTELFFSADGYTVSIVPYVWKDLQNCIQKSKILKCNPKNKSNTQPLFLRVDGELEQIFFENSTRHTMLSTCFKLSIRPTVIFKNILPIKVHVLIEGIAGEHPVLPAMTIQIPTAEPGNSSLVVRIPEYLDREWSSKNELLEDPPELSVWSFDSFESCHHITIDLGVHMELSNGTHKYTLYCPFWMINKTSLQLAYKRSSKAEKEPSSPEHSDEATSLFHPENYSGVIMFSFKPKSFFVKKKSSIKVFDGPWSDKFSLDAVGSSGVVICRHENQTYHIGVKIQLSNNPLTKEVVFTPFYVFLNNFKKNILEIREVTDTEEHKWISVPPEDCIPFWPNGKPDTSRLQTRIEGTEETSIAFPFNKSYNNVLKVANKFGAIDVDVQLSDGGAYISFYSYEMGMAPVLIMNQTNHTVDFCDMSAKETCYYLKPRQKMLFTWEKICDNHQISFCKGEFTSNLKQDNMGQFVVRNNEQLYWSTFLYGPQRVFLITDSHFIAAESINLSDYQEAGNTIEVKLQGIGLSLIDNTKKRELLYISLSCSEVAWEARKPEKKLYKKLSANDSAAIERSYKDYLDSCSYGFETKPVVKVNNRITVDFKNLVMKLPVEKMLNRSYVDGVWISIKNSSYLTRFHMKINSIQIDQQVYDCVFPVIFAPVPAPKSVINQLTPKPFLEVSLVKMTNQFSYLQQFKYFAVLVQEFHFRADTGVLSNLMNFFEPAETSEEVQISLMEIDVKRAQEPLCFFVYQTSKQESKNYYGKLHLSPLKMHVSFSLSSGESSSSGEDSLMPPILSVFMQSFGVTLTDVDDVIFRINCFERESIFVTQTQLVGDVTSHYVSQILKQLYVVILGLDVIGNPFGLISGLKTGATDFFYEPIQGAIRGPGEFAEGLVLGVRSLFGHTVGGAAGAVSKMTGALGKGLAALTFDDDYQRHRREMQRSKPATMQEGFARSGKGLVLGVIEGVGGVVTKPISGAKQEGVSGFFKGVGKGMVGLITRPTAGIVDFASGSLGAVRRATDVSSELPRKRIPRYIRPDGLIKPYCEDEAEGNRFLQELDKGKYAKTDEYVFHMPIGYATKFKDVLLLTDRRMVYLAYNEIFGGYQLEWGHTWLEITKEPELVNDGIKFWVDRKTTLKTLFLSPDSGKILFIDNSLLKNYVLQLMNQMILKNTAALGKKESSSMSLASGEVLQWTFLIVLAVISGESNLLMSFWLSRFSKKRSLKNRQQLQ